MRIIIVLSGGVVQRVIADSDLEYRIVDLDTEEYSADSFSPDIVQMENDEQAAAVARSLISSTANTNWAAWGIGFANGRAGWGASNPYDHSDEDYMNGYGAGKRERQRHPTQD